jgi:tetratricopeptide (TPR) repeat protein
VAGAGAATDALRAKNALLGMSAPGQFKTMATAMGGFTRNVKLATSAMKIMRLVMISTGIGVIILGIGLAIMLVVKNFSTFKEKSSGAINSVKQAFKTFMSALKEIARPILDLFKSFDDGGAKGKSAIGGLSKAFGGIAKAISFVADLFKKFVLNFIQPYLYYIVNLVMVVVSIFQGNWGNALDFLISAFSHVGKIIVVIMKFAFKALVAVAALAIKGILTSITLIPKTLAKAAGFLGKFIPGFTAISEGINSVVDGMFGMVDGAKNLAMGAIDGVADAIGSKLESGAKKGISNTKEAVDLGGKKIVDSGEEIGYDTGEAIANAAGDGYDDNDPSEKIGKALKDGIDDAVQELQDYVAGELKNAIDKYVNASIKALEKQKTSALKVFDVQLKTLMKLEKAEESLTKTKEYEANKRKLIDDKALSDEQYRRNYALAVYEGRIDDARMLQLEQSASEKNYSENLKGIESDRAKDLAKENLEALKEAINEAKDAASVFFDEAIEKFQESIEVITKFPPVTIEDYRNQIEQLYTITNDTAAANSEAFEKMFTDFASTINDKMPNEVVGAFTTNLDDLVRVAREKYGLGGEAGEDTIIGATIGMLADIGGTFGDGKQVVIDKFGEVTTGFKNNFAAASTAIVKSVTDDFLTPFAEATTKFRENWNNVYVQAIKDGNQAITDSLRNNVKINEELFKKLRGELTETSLYWLNLKAAADAAADAQSAASGGGGVDSPTSITPKGSFTPAGGRADAFENNNRNRVDRGLPPISYQEFISGTGRSTSQLQIIRNPIRQFAKGGMVPSGSVNQNFGMPEGYISAPRQEGVPTLLHGGEYILNAKAVSRIGIGALNKMNNNLLPKFAKGGQVPGGKRGSASNTRGSADRLEASNLARISKAQNQRNADLKNVGIAKNFIGPIAPVVKSESKSILGKIGSFAREMAKPSNSFAMIGAAIGTALGGLGGFGFGAVPGGIGGAAIGGAIGTFTEQSFDKVKGFQPLAIAKNAVMQGVFQAAGIGVAKYVAPLLKPSSLKLMLQSKFPGVGSYLSGTVGRLFGKSATSEVADVALRTIPLPKFQSALPAGSRPFGALMQGKAPEAVESIAAKVEELARINGAIPLPRPAPTGPLPTVNLSNYLLHGGPATEQLLGGKLNPEFIRGGKLWNVLKSARLGGSIGRSSMDEPSVLTGSELGQNQDIIELYKKIISIANNANKYSADDYVPLALKSGSGSEVVSGIPYYYDSARGNAFYRWGDQVKAAKNWLIENADIVKRTLKGESHMTGVFPSYGSHTYDQHGATHLLKIPDSLNSIAGEYPLRDIFSLPSQEIPFWGMHTPIASLPKGSQVIGNDVQTWYKKFFPLIEAMIDDANKTLSPTDLAAFALSQKAYGNTITPAARSYIISEFNNNAYRLYNREAIPAMVKQLQMATSKEEMLQIVSNGTRIMTGSEYQMSPVELAIDQLKGTISHFAPRPLSLAGNAATGNILNNIIQSGTDAAMYGVADKVGSITYGEAISSARDTAFLNSLPEQSRQLFIDAMHGDAVNRSLKLLPDLPDVDMTINKLKGLPGFKTGGYVPGSPSMAIPALLHGGEYVVNADAVRNMGVRTMQSINQSKFRTPSSAPSYMGGGQTTNVSTVNINVDTFVGEEEWFKSMMKSYNVNVLPKQQKAAGMETRTFTSYNGINQGL